MKNLPKKIYLQIDSDSETPDDFSELSGVSWCADKVHDNDIAYVLESPSDSEAVERNRVYRLMIYFAHSTICFYSKSVVNTGKMTVEQFKEENKAVVKRVFDEGLSIMNYELSDYQMSAAIAAFLAPSQRVETTSVYQLK